MLRVIVETEFLLDDPNVDQGLVTWFDVRIRAGHGDENLEIESALERERERTWKQFPEMHWDTL